MELPVEMINYNQHVINKSVRNENNKIGFTISCMMFLCLTAYAEEQEELGI